MTLVMVLDVLRAGSLEMLGTLGRSSVEATLVAAVVWGLCRSMPAVPPAVRAWLWWLISLKLMLGLLGVPAVPLSWLPAPAWSLPAATTYVSPLTLPVPDALLVGEVIGARGTTPRQTPVAIPYTSLWPMALLALWVVVAVAHAAGLVRALGAARHLRRLATPAPAGIVSRAAYLARQFALPVIPRILASRLTSVPLLTGVIRPAILFPDTSTLALSRAEVDLVLGHELAHVRRGDLVWGWVPALASRLFFFHPLARLAAREYLAAREEACDAEVLQTLDAAPADYGRLLVKLGVATTDDVLAAAGSSPTFELLKRRLIMLDRSRTPASRWWWTMAGATAVLVPLTLVAQPASSGATLPVVAPAAAPTSMPAAAPTPAPATVVRQQTAAEVPVPPDPPRQAPPTPPAPPVPPAPPAPPALTQEPVGHRTRHNDHPWVLLGPGSHNIMSGGPDDKAAAERQRGVGPDTLLWFRHHGVEYVTYDAATIQAVRDAFAPANAAGDSMGRVGATMGARGGAQGAIGARQGELGARQAALAARMAALATVETNRATEHAQREQSRQELQVRREALEAELKTLAEQQQALGHEMRALGRTMEAHGAEMEAKNRTLQEALAAAQAKTAGIFSDAVASGKAVRAR